MNCQLTYQDLTHFRAVLSGWSSALVAQTTAETMPGPDADDHTDERRQREGQGLTDPDETAGATGATAAAAAESSEMAFFEDDGGEEGEEDEPSMQVRDVKAEWFSRTEACFWGHRPAPTHTQRGAESVAACQRLRDANGNCFYLFLNTKQVQYPNVAFLLCKVYDTQLLVVGSDMLRP